MDPIWDTERVNHLQKQPGAAMVEVHEVPFRMIADFLWRNQRFLAEVDGYVGPGGEPQRAFLMNTVNVVEIACPPDCPDRRAT